MVRRRFTEGKAITLDANAACAALTHLANDKRTRLNV